MARHAVVYLLDAFANGGIGLGELKELTFTQLCDATPLSIGSRRSCGSTCPRPGAAGRHGCCAWVISLLALAPSPFGKGAEPQGFAGQPTVPGPLLPPVPNLLAIARHTCHVSG